jgi:hypothetical protein
MLEKTRSFELGDDGFFGEDSAIPAPTEADLPHNPYLNRGSAFPLADRRARRIEGRLLQGADTAPDRACCGGSGPR